MANIELSKAYEAKEVEDNIYKKWEESGYFNPDNLPSQSEGKFVVCMPPPNVTGVLHLGHALENSLMDTELRYQRMKGKRALLIPGTDHAAVATQARVEGNLRKEGMLNPRQELGREGLLNKIREYAENSKTTILSQIRKMGTSCDWSRLAYTFDEPRSRAVNTLFKKMYDDALIYRGYRVVNWSVKGQSTCSDDELVYQPQKSKLYTFKYSADFPIAIASTRPETKLGDVAVAVHPNDERYQKYIGQKFTIDLGAKEKQTITIIADEAVDPKYGTGAIGVTPAHSQIDFEMYQKNKEISIVPVIGKDGKMLEAAGKYQGFGLLEAREKLVEWLKENNLLIKEEDIENNIGTSDRFGDVVEALPMEQWFVDVNKIIPGRNKTLKDLMREAVTSGHNNQEEKKIIINPDQFHNIYLHWIDNLRDWCISRQIWWGHRIPVAYCDKCQKNFYTEEESPLCPKCQAQARRDDDTLDTWFSSGAWTFSTLGWPDNKEELNKFHPTEWMQMGYEILFFWMARMILMTTYALDDIPFKNVYIHGILRAKDGRKFSKSLGNGLDPLEVINQYGTDALRLSLMKGITPGNDARFYEEKVEASRNFVNKLWNISRFILGKIEAEKVKNIKERPEAKTLADKWLLNKLDGIILKTTKELDNHNFSLAAEILYEFTWSDFADWYLEIAKIENGKDEILIYTLKTLLKLWHPYIPFVTEEIWNKLGEEKMLLIEKWPTVGKIHENDSNKENLNELVNNVNNIFAEKDKAEKEFEQIKEIIIALRNLRMENKIEPVKLVKALLIVGSKEELINSQKEIIKRLGRLEELEIVNNKQKPTNFAVQVINDMEVCLNLAGLIDVEAEKKKINEEIEQTKKYIISLEERLANQEFIARAPEKIILELKEKLELSRARLQKLTERVTII